MPKPRPITVVKNFGGRRLAEGETPSAIKDWSVWCCDPTVANKQPTRGFAYGSSFPWHFDKEEKAFVLEGEATLTPDDPALHGEPVRIAPRDMVTFPRGWRGRWDIHSYIRKRYAFFDGKGLRVDEASDDEEEEEGENTTEAIGKHSDGEKDGKEKNARTVGTKVKAAAASKAADAPKSKRNKKK